MEKTLVSKDRMDMVSCTRSQSYNQERHTKFSNEKETTIPGDRHIWCWLRSRTAVLKGGH